MVSGTTGAACSDLYLHKMGKIRVIGDKLFSRSSTIMVLATSSSVVVLVHRHQLNLEMLAFVVASQITLLGQVLLRQKLIRILISSTLKVKSYVITIAI